MMNLYESICATSSTVHDQPNTPPLSALIALVDFCQRWSQELLAAFSGASGWNDEHAIFAGPTSKDEIIQLGIRLNSVIANLPGGHATCEVPDLAISNPASAASMVLTGFELECARLHRYCDFEYLLAQQAAWGKLLPEKYHCLVRSLRRNSISDDALGLTPSDFGSPNGVTPDLAQLRYLMTLSNSDLPNLYSIQDAQAHCCLWSMQT